MKSISTSNTLPDSLAEDPNRNVANDLATLVQGHDASFGLTNNETTTLQALIADYEAKFGQFAQDDADLDAARTTVNNLKDAIASVKDNAEGARNSVRNQLLKMMATMTNVPDEQLEARLAQLAPAGWEGKRGYFNRPMTCTQLTATPLDDGTYNSNWVIPPKEELPTGGMAGEPDVYYLDDVIVKAVSNSVTNCVMTLPSGEHHLAVAAVNDAGISNHNMLHINRIAITVP